MGDEREEPAGTRARFVFIAGYMHSGTTLVGQVIANLPRSYRPPHETKFLGRLPAMRRSYPDLDDPDQAAEFRAMCTGLLDESSRAFVEQARDGRPAPVGEVDAHLAAFLDVVRGHLADREADVFVEHTGTNVLGHRDLRRVPDAFMVDIVRDPRDVVASKKTRLLTVHSGRYTAEQARRKVHEKSFEPVVDTLAWRSFVRQGAAAAASLGPRYRRVRYEDLVADPDAVLAEVADLLGVEPAEGTVSVTVNNSADPSVVRSGIDARSTGRWTTVLLPYEAAAVRWLARRELAELGYAEPPPRFPPVLALVRCTPRALLEPGRRLYHRYRLGGVSLVRTLVSDRLRRR